MTYIAYHTYYNKTEYNRCGDSGQNLAQMAFAWVYSRKEVTSVLIGASKPEQMLNNIGMLQNTLFTEEELCKIDTIIHYNKKTDFS